MSKLVLIGCLVMAACSHAQPKKGKESARPSVPPTGTVTCWDDNNGGIPDGLAHTMCIDDTGKVTDMGRATQGKARDWVGFNDRKQLKPGQECLPLVDHMSRGWCTTPFVCDKTGHWVPDWDAEDASAKRVKHKNDLMWALRTRVLTEAEMLEVKEQNVNLLMPDCGTVPPMDQLWRVMDDALLLQFKLRASAPKGGGTK